MALITAKESENALFFSAREFMIAPLTFEGDWTEIRCGFFVSGCDANFESEVNSDDELRSVSNVSDLITIGLKNSDTLDLPGEAGAIFLGLKSGESFGSEQGKFTNPDPLVSSSRGSAANYLGFLSGVGYNGVTEIGPSLMGESAVEFPLITPDEGYCGFYCLKFVISNRGDSNQAVNVYVAGISKVSGGDYSPIALRALMHSIEFEAPTTIAWNSAGVALDIPDAFYMRLPFFNNRLMLASMMAVQYQP